MKLTQKDTPFRLILGLEYTAAVNVSRVWSACLLLVLACYPLGDNP